MGVANGMVAAGQGPASGGPGFDAFMSYSHAVDGRLAPALQQRVQTLGKPGGDAQPCLSQAEMRSATMIVGRLVLAEGIIGMTDASAT